MFEFIKDCGIEKINENDILDLEKKYMFRFPNDMKLFYLEHNPGRLNDCKVKIKGGIELSSFFPIKNTCVRLLTIDRLLEWQKMDNLTPMNLVPFASDYADNTFYIDLSEGKYGNIYHLDHEFWPDFKNGEYPKAVADSFFDFVKRINTILLP